METLANNFFFLFPSPLFTIYLRYMSVQDIPVNYFLPHTALLDRISERQLQILFWNICDMIEVKNIEKCFSFNVSEALFLAVTSIDLSIYLQDKDIWAGENLTVCKVASVEASPVLFGSEFNFAAKPKWSLWEPCIACCHLWYSFSCFSWTFSDFIHRKCPWSVLIKK